MKPYYESGTVTFYHADCIELLPSINADLLLTDPPYGLGKAWKRTNHGANGTSRLWGDTPSWDKPNQKLMDALLAKDIPKVIWGAYNYKMPPCSTFLVWDKKQTSRRSECELAWTTLTCGHKIFRMSRIDAYWNKALFKKEHPNEKPIQLMDWCVGWFPKARVILDPLMGCGSSIIAAKQAGLKAIGVELDEKYCEIAARRLETIKVHTT